MEQTPAHRALERLTIDVLDGGASPLVRLDGDLDAASAPALIEVAERVVRDGTSTLIIDCGSLRFCDSSGLRSLIVAQGLLPDGAKIGLVRASERFRELLHITGLESMFEVT